MDHILGKGAAGTKGRRSGTPGNGSFGTVDLDRSEELAEHTLDKVDAPWNVAQRIEQKCDAGAHKQDKIGQR